MFARLTLDDEEFALYEQVYERLAIDAPLPDLVVYLQAPVDVLLERIARDGIFRMAPAGAVMFDAHSPCAGFPLVLAGTIRNLGLEWPKIDDAKRRQIDEARRLLEAE